MFGKSGEASQSRSQSILQEGVAVRGDIRSEGELRLDGSLEGSLVAKARVIVGPTGDVQADIEATDVVVLGRVRGKVTGHRRIELRKGARMEGDLQTQSLVIEEGVYFQGLCQMAVPTIVSGDGVDGEGRAHGSDTLRGLRKDLRTGSQGKD